MVGRRHIRVSLPYPRMYTMVSLPYPRVYNQGVPQDPRVYNQGVPQDPRVYHRVCSHAPRCTIGYASHAPRCTSGCTSARCTSGCTSARCTSGYTRACLSGLLYPGMPLGTVIHCYSRVWESYSLLFRVWESYTLVLSLFYTQFELLFHRFMPGLSSFSTRFGAERPINQEVGEMSRSTPVSLLVGVIPAVSHRLGRLCLFNRGFTWGWDTF